jgi:hypothetical protein
MKLKRKDPPVKKGWEKKRKLTPQAKDSLRGIDKAYGDYYKQWEPGMPKPNRKHETSVKARLREGGEAELNDTRGLIKEIEAREDDENYEWGTGNAIKNPNASRYNYDGTIKTEKKASTPKTKKKNASVSAKEKKDWFK